MTKQSPYERINPKNLTVHLTSVTIADSGRTFAAYVVNGQNWNGWVIPYFDRIAADQVMTWMNNDPWPEGSIEETVTVNYLDDGYQVIDQGHPSIVPQTLIVLEDGTEVTTWAIGGGSWTWEEDLPSSPAYTPEQLTEIREEIQVEELRKDTEWQEGYNAAIAAKAALSMLIDSQFARLWRDLKAWALREQQLTEGNVLQQQEINILLHRISRAEAGDPDAFKTI